MGKGEDRSPRVLSIKEAPAQATLMMVCVAVTVLFARFMRTRFNYSAPIPLEALTGIDNDDGGDKTAKAAAEVAEATLLDGVGPKDHSTAPASATDVTLQYAEGDTALNIESIPSLPSTHPSERIERTRLTCATDFGKLPSVVESEVKQAPGDAFDGSHVFLPEPLHALLGDVTQEGAAAAADGESVVPTFFSTP